MLTALTGAACAPATETAPTPGPATAPGTPASTPGMPAGTPTSPPASGPGVEVAFTALLLAADPLAAGWDPLGVADRRADYGLLTPAAIANAQTVALVLGHVVGVVTAHDRALRLYPGGAVARQMPMLVLMVAYTVSGLLLLFQE